MFSDILRIRGGNKISEKLLKREYNTKIMDKWQISRKVVSSLLGILWGFRVEVVVKYGFTLIDYLISFLGVVILLSLMSFFISKQFKTNDVNKIKKEIWKDVIWAIIFIFVTLGFKYILSKLWSIN